jgi:RNA polymerase sigma-70 factor (ECF subfamily)
LKIRTGAVIERREETMESDPRQAEQPSADAGAAFILCQFVERKIDVLISTMRLYLFKAGLGNHDPAELLNRVMVEALSCEDRFDTARQPMAWLLAIAANLIKRERAEKFKRASREVPINDLRADPNDPSETDSFDRLTSVGPDMTVEDEKEAERILSLVEEDDRQVLRLSVVEEMGAEELARELGVSRGAARVRKYRALERLRAALQKEARRSEGE